MNIKEMRKEKGLTQKQLAEPVSYTHLRAHETS